MQKKVYLILALVIALALGAGAASPTRVTAVQAAQETGTQQCRSGVDALTGTLAALPRVPERARLLCEFNIRLNDIDPARVSQFDRQFIQNAIAGNMLEIEALEFTLERVQDEEWRGLLQMMIAHHRHDLEMAIQIAERLGLDTNPDLTNVRVYPYTPEFDLGIRRVDLVARYLDPLMAAGGGLPTETPTAIPTLGTGTATTMPTEGLTSTPTLVPTETATGVPTLVPTDTATTIPTMDLTGTATVDPTVSPTDTPTAVPTFTLTETPTAAPTLTLTETPTAVPTFTLTETSTAIPTLGATDTATLPPTVNVTATGTVLPTTVPPDGTGADFNLVALHIIEEIHVMHVQTALTAQRLVQNDEIRAFAKHAADVAGLHLLLLSDLKHRLFDQYTPAPPQITEPYTGPRRFGSGRE